MKSTKTIPIIFETGSDPVARGFVASLPHPERNLTGISWMAHELGGKRLELLKDTVPKLTRVAVVSGPDQRNYDVQMRVLESAAQGLHLELQALPIQNSDDVEKAFSAMTTANVQAFFLIVNPAFGGFRNKNPGPRSKNQITRDVFKPRDCQRRWPDDLRARSDCYRAASSRLR